MWLLSIVSISWAIDAGHSGLQHVLDLNVANGRVNYANIKAHPEALRAYLAEVASAPIDRMDAGTLKAFYINAYNALTVSVIAENFPIGSIRDLDGGKVWDTRTFQVGSQSLTLNDIEHKRLRPLGDPRIHAALNCGARGCPALSGTVFIGAALDTQLDGASSRWAATAQLAGGTLTVNRIWDWYGEDFVPKFGASTFDIPGMGGKAEAAANFIAHYAPGQAAALHAGHYTVEYAPYDWSVNAQ